MSVQRVPTDNLTVLGRTVRHAIEHVECFPAPAHVTLIRSHLIAPNQVRATDGIVYDVVFLDLKPDDSPEALAGIQAALRSVEGITVAIAGGPAFYADIQSVSESDLRRSELISLPLAALVLLLVFGSAVSAGLPLAVGGAAVLVALATIFGIAQATRMSVFVLNLTTLLCLGLGVDYSLLLVSRFREELTRSDVADAVRRTVATAGRAVFFSGVTVMLGLAAERWQVDAAACAVAAQRFVVSKRLRGNATQDLCQFPRIAQTEIEALRANGRHQVSGFADQGDAVGGKLACGLDGERELATTSGTQRYLTENGVEAAKINKMSEGRPHVVDAIKNGQIQLVFNTTEGATALADSKPLRRAALLHKVPYYTTLSGAVAAARACRGGGHGSTQRHRRIWSR